MNLCNEFYNVMDFIMTVNQFKRLSLINLMNLNHYCNGNLVGDGFTQMIYFIKGKDFKEDMNLVDLLNQIYVMISSCQ